MYNRSLEDIFSGKIEDTNDKNQKNNKRDDNRRDNNNNNSSKNKKKNDLSSIYSSNNPSIYDRDQILNILVKKHGLLIMISDIKKSRKHNIPNGASYIYNAIRDIIFASALPEAIDKVFFDKNNDVSDNDFGVSKKDLDYLMDEILSFCNSRNNRLIEKYGYDSVNSMIKAYSNILYKLNKKKMKKFKDISNLSEGSIKRMIVLTAGKNIRNSIYQLLKYFYEMASDKSFNFNKKNIIKIFKACYGKKCMPDVAKCLMLEKSPNYEMNKSVSDLWVLLDEIMRDTLEDLPKSKIEEIVKDYISTRRHQERNGKINRRLGDRRNIHPEDYKKLTKVFESLEDKDFSVIPLLRN